MMVCTYGPQLLWKLRQDCLSPGVQGQSGQDNESQCLKQSRVAGGVMIEYLPSVHKVLWV
jgi:hypothetical protein